jgi:anionic cell wall polymer biosynthesis LytR-Cps2A-Psr (LCP) family protein
MLPKSGKRDASPFLLAVIVLLLVGGIVAAALTFRSDPIGAVLSNDRVISVLYIIEKDQKPLATYVLMCYPGTRRAAIIDIPGELGIRIRRANRVGRIDSVYDPNRIAAFEEEIESLLGVDIAFSIVASIENLGRAVDLLEGVEVFSPSQVDIRDGGALVLFPSGISLLDGDKAVSYISYEAPGEDSEMAVFRRQRFFQAFLKRQAQMNEVLKHPLVSRLYQSFFQTSLNRRARLRLFDEIALMDLDRASIQSVGGNLREVSGQMLLIPHWDGNLVKDIVRQALGTLTRPAEGFLIDRVFTVEVLNGTPVTGLAGRTAEVLRGFGYDVISTGNADHSGHERTLIIDRSGYTVMARYFADIIRCENIRIETPARENLEGELALQSLEYRSDFTLILGRDFNGRYVTRN